MPDKFDIKGTGAITDMVDNVFIVWRNKQKEAKMHEAITDHSRDMLRRSSPDCILNCVKQREGEWEGFVKLWFDAASLQFLEDADMPPLSYVDSVDFVTSIPADAAVQEAF